MEFESTSWWLFAEELPEAGALFEFCQLEKYGKKGQVMLFLGKVKDRVGDWKVFPSKIVNLKELIKALGSDETKWATKRFTLKPNAEKKQIIATLV